MFFFPSRYYKPHEDKDSICSLLYTGEHAAQSLDGVGAQ